ncbi:MAG: SigB/SigF/SigG family RNA polymerase sigma factor [Armatimonadota bacterium]
MLFAMVAEPEEKRARHEEETVRQQDDLIENHNDEEIETPVIEEAEAEGDEEVVTPTVEAEPAPVAVQTEDRHDDDLFLRYYRSRSPVIREQLVMNHMNLVRFLAKKFANRGEPLDDLIGVGTIGLMHAIDRFDPERGIRFATFATPTIVGEIKRHFRDRGWAIKVPRRLQEVNLAANKAVEALTLKLNRAPTVQEVATHINASLEETLEGMELGHLYELISLDNELGDDDDESRSRLEDYVGKEDVAFEEFSERTRLEAAIGRLTPRERKIIILRFFKGWSQTDVARELNISQMHVSRLQHKALARLREMVDSEEV